MSELKTFTTRPKGRVVYQANIEAEDLASVYLIHPNGEEQLVFQGLKCHAERIEHEARIAQKSANNTQSPWLFCILIQE